MKKLNEYKTGISNFAKLRLNRYGKELIRITKLIVVKSFNDPLISYYGS